MPSRTHDSSAAAQQRQTALSRWENEGGAAVHRPRGDPTVGDLQSRGAKLANSELAQLRCRVIALENLVVTLLAQTSDRELERAREMAAYISPRLGFTQHPLTIHAAARMVQLVKRASHCRADGAAVAAPTPRSR